MKFLIWMPYHLETDAIVIDYIGMIKKYLKDHEVVICDDLETAKKEIVDADAMIGWRIVPEVFSEAKKLKWIQFGSAGIDHTIFPELIESDVILTNLSGTHVVPVAEHVFAMMLALSRRLHVAFELKSKHSFDRSDMAAKSEELNGKTLGIIGLGKIGLGIAKFAKAFEMNVIGTKKTVEGALPNVDRIYPPSGLCEVLNKSDYLVLIMPLTDDTYALIGKQEIERMRSGSYLINVARGAMVDHNALAEALKSGHLAGAALDVFPIEPLPEDSEIWNLPNIIITPHTAGATPEYGRRAAEIFKTNLNAFLTGGQMINVYDRSKGY